MRRLRWMSAMVLLVVGAGIALHEPERPDAGRFAGLEVAHRGGSPENTLVAIERAAAAGATAVEVDVRLTADGIPVAFHDGALDDLTGEPGRVGDRTLSELRAMRVDGEPIPTLEEVVEEVIAHDLKLEIELKWSSRDHATLTSEVADLFAAHHLHERAWVASFDPTLLWRVQRADPAIVTALAVGSLDTGSRRVDRLLSTAWLGRFMGVGMVELPHTWVDGRTALKWADRGVVLNAWTANDPGEKARLRDLGVTYTTDRPAVTPGSG